MCQGLWLTIARAPACAHTVLGATTLGTLCIMMLNFMSTNIEVFNF